MTTQPNQYEVLVVGAGQSGLAIGYHLKRLGIDFVLLDAAPDIGHVWRHRWDSLRLFTSARYSSLPGSPFLGDPDRYPTKDEVADYLRDYARRYELPTRLNERVERVGASGDGYSVTTRRCSYDARSVVIAVGGRHVPVEPPFAAELSHEMLQLHSGRYQRPDQLPQGTVAVIGSGDSGRQIAQELAESGRRVIVSRGAWRLRLPQRLLGRDIFYWLDKMSVLSVPAEAPRVRWVRRHEPVVAATFRSLRRKGVRVVGRAIGAAGATITFEGGHQERPAAVVWCTGFRSEFSWVDLPVFDHAGHPAQEAGITALPGLYFLGVPWQRVTGSALIGWVGKDAAILADHIALRKPKDSGG
ncbi:MAG: NAD(P)/FAD-dependent oxidoreductase [Actinomycetota bacterium]|nr:NAD(P)/FAD-dependent oxidoreductase [Actinomycetota bacterium]